MSRNLPAERADFERADFATPAIADRWEAEALEGIENVETPEEAETLLLKVRVADQAIRIARLGEEREKRWHKVKLLAERKYGELLGPAVEGGDPKAPDKVSGGVSDAVSATSMEIERAYRRRS